MQSRLAGPMLAAVTSLAGCASYESHLLDERHPWHAYPTVSGTMIGVVPFLPFALAESAITGETLGPRANNASFHLGMLVGLPIGQVVGAAFLVAGSPLELAFPLEDETPAPSRGPPPGVAVNTRRRPGEGYLRSADEE